MKVKVISRNPDEYLRETKQQIHKAPRNYDPDLHPLESAREYVRALNAVKLERVFAKPFIGNLHGHRDSVSCLAKHSNRLSEILSGGWDGEVRVWDVPQQKCVRNFVAHEGMVMGIAYQSSGAHFFSIGNDKTIKTWNAVAPEMHEEEEPLNTIINKNVLMSISHHRTAAMFATGGDICQIWEESRNEPVQTYKWGVNSLHHVAFNKVETHLLSACASDRRIILYDIRDTAPAGNVVMKMKSNCVAWNPMEAYIFTAANEDYNLYTFDTRKLKCPVNVHMDHVSAVIDVDYSPTGKEFVAGSYDKCIRIFETGKGHSRDIYHTKRMQRPTCVQWSLDNKYIFNGSDEMNIRIWKAHASEKLGTLRPREKAALNYSEALKEKFAAHPQVRRIARHRQVPKHIFNSQNELRQMKLKAKRKEDNLRRHSKKNSVPRVPERKKHVVQEDK